MSFFRNLFFGSPEVVPPVVNRTPTSNSNGGVRAKVTPATDDPDIKLAVSKAVGQLAFITKSYDFALCEGTHDDLKADLQTMLAYGDLSSIRLELLGASKRVLFEFRLNFNASRANGRGVDTGKGVELPMLDRRLVSSKRLIIQRNGRDAAYKHLLKLNWSDAPTFEKAAGSQYGSDHAAAISGGRQTAAFHVADVARHRFAITQVGTKGFGFARETDSGRDGVFVLASQLPTGVPFVVGAQFTAVLVQTPRGLQVRSCSASERSVAAGTVCFPAAWQRTRRQSCHWYS